MSVFTTFSEPLCINYKTKVCSLGTLFNAIIWLLALIIPFLICYRTQGFWLKLDLVHEQPIIQFKHEALLILETQKYSDNNNIKSESLIWTTFPGLYAMLPNKITPFILSREGDENMDKIKEYLDIEISIPLDKSVAVQGVHLILVFDYRIYKYASLHMESLVYINFISGVKANHFEFYGDISLSQKQPLWTRVHDERYNKPVIPINSTTLSDYSIGKILRDYSSRNVSTILKNKYELWLDSPSAMKEFVVKGRINYSEQTYECWAGFWNTVKWTWIQYFTVFVIVGLLLKKFQRCVIRANFFEMELKTPWRKQ